MRVILLYLSIIGILFFDQNYTNCAALPMVTNSPRSDGFGAQFLFIIGCVAFAELHNLEFVYTPFRNMEHNYDNDPHFLAKKEWLINFMDNYKINKIDNLISPDNPIDFFFSAENLINFANSVSLNKIKKNFRLNKDHKNYFSNNNLNISIHIRRPNSHDSRIDGTDTPNYVFLNIIKRLRIIYYSKNPLFHIISQGNYENFKEFQAIDTILHLNESIEESFCSMVFADVLVTSRSTFSYTAALLSNGIIYYIPFCCAPLPHWISI